MQSRESNSQCPSTNNNPPKNTDHNHINNKTDKQSSTEYITFSQLERKSERVKTYSSQDSPPNSKLPTWDTPPPIPPTHSIPVSHTHSTPKSVTPVNSSSYSSHPQTPPHSPPNATNSTVPISENFLTWKCDCWIDRWSRKRRVLPIGVRWRVWRVSGVLVLVRRGDWFVVRRFGLFRLRDAWYNSII